MVPRLDMCWSIISWSKITHQMWRDHQFSTQNKAIKKRGVGKIGGFISKGIRKPLPTMFLNNLKDLVLSPEATPGFFCDTIWLTFPLLKYNIRWFMAFVREVTLWTNLSLKCLFAYFVCRWLKIDHALTKTNKCYECKACN